MAYSSGFGDVLIKSENRVHGNAWTDEHDCIPLKKRLKQLLANKRLSDFSDIQCEIESERTSTASIDVVLEKEDHQCDSPVENPDGFGQEESNDRLSPKQSHAGTIRQCSSQGTEVKDYAISKDNNLISSLENHVEIFLGNDLHSIEIKTEIADEFVDELDHIVLKERRRRLLLSRKPLELIKMVQDNRSARNIVRRQDSNGLCSSNNASARNEPYGRQNFVFNKPRSSFSSALSSTFVSIKAEPLDYKELHSLDNNAVCDFPSSSIVPVKNDMEMPEESCEDKVDHMLLRDRINWMASQESLDLDNSRKFDCSKKIVPSFLNCRPIAFESAKPIRVNHPRKRRKTATDSVETALEEDVPGLLQVLIDKGISVNEIKLYGEPEGDETLDDSQCEDSFSELETVISKLFTQRQSFLKFAPIHCMKGEKPSYCLACLVSLVEQARYLQFRKWPVEWGWSRDLQSFIFVFERHNRIVLERPEYGYATYFFELVDYMSIDWQIRRLVTAMKLTSCSRTTLIENKALLVGEDLSEGEARVLMEYGWVRDSGLGTMLNYCDRVVHDRKNENDSSEWRSKIGRLLMDGYNGGTIVSPEIPKKVVECSGDPGPQIKLET
ncbi:hypothetical protein NMG60_11026544 [Bertholletia excelsa]